MNTRSPFEPQSAFLVILLLGVSLFMSCFAPPQSLEEDEIDLALLQEYYAARTEGEWRDEFNAFLDRIIQGIEDGDRYLGFHPWMLDWKDPFSSWDDQGVRCGAIVRGNVVLFRYPYEYLSNEAFIQEGLRIQIIDHVIFDQQRPLIDFQDLDLDLVDGDLFIRFNKVGDYAEAVHSLPDGVYEYWLADDVYNPLERYSWGGGVMPLVIVGEEASLQTLENWQKIYDSYGSEYTWISGADITWMLRSGSFMDYIPTKKEFAQILADRE